MTRTDKTRYYPIIDFVRDLAIEDGTDEKDVAHWLIDKLEGLDPRIFFILPTDNQKRFIPSQPYKILEALNEFSSTGQWLKSEIEVVQERKSDYPITIWDKPLRHGFTVRDALFERDDMAVTMHCSERALPMFWHLEPSGHRDHVSETFDKDRYFNLYEFWKLYSKDPKTVNVRSDFIDKFSYFFQIECGGRIEFQLAGDKEAKYCVDRLEYFVYDEILKRERWEEIIPWKVCEDGKLQLYRNKEETNNKNQRILKLAAMDALISRIDMAKFFIICGRMNKDFLFPAFWNAEKDICGAQPIIHEYELRKKEYRTEKKIPEDVQVLKKGLLQAFQVTDEKQLPRYPFIPLLEIAAMYGGGLKAIDILRAWERKFLTSKEVINTAGILCLFKAEESLHFFEENAPMEQETLARVGKNIERLKSIIRSSKSAPIDVGEEIMNMGEEKLAEILGISVPEAKLRMSTTGIYLSELNKILSHLDLKLIDENERTDLEQLAKKIRSEIARNAANVKHDLTRKVKDYALKIFDETSPKKRSLRQTAMAIESDVIVFAKNIGINNLRRNSLYNTILKWVRERNKVT